MEKADRAQIGCDASVEADGLLLGSSPAPFTPANRSCDGRAGRQKTNHGQKYHADHQEESGSQILQRYGCHHPDLIALKNVSTTLPAAHAAPWSLGIVFAEPTAAFGTVSCPDLAGSWTDEGESLRNPASLWKARPHLHAPHRFRGHQRPVRRPGTSASCEGMRNRFIAGLARAEASRSPKDKSTPRRRGTYPFEGGLRHGCITGAGSAIRHADEDNSFAPPALSSLAHPGAVLNFASV